MRNKKLFQTFLAVAVIFTGLGLTAEACPNNCQRPPREDFSRDRIYPPKPHKQLSPEQRAKMNQEHAKRKAQFESRLKLTDAQKKKIEQNRIESQKQIKPLFDKIKVDKKKITDIKESNRALSEKDKMIVPIQEEIKTIRKQIHQIREDNRKYFESVLTDKQKKELAKMNAERKKNMQGKKKCCPPPPPMD